MLTFPLPTGPMMAQSCPGLTRKDTSLSAGSVEAEVAHDAVTPESDTRESLEEDDGLLEVDGEREDSSGRSKKV